MVCEIHSSQNKYFIVSKTLYPSQKPLRETMLENQVHYFVCESTYIKIKALMPKRLIKGAITNQ